MHRERKVALVFMADQWDAPSRRVVVHPRSGDEELIKVNFFEPTCAALDAPERLGIRADTRQLVVILGTEVNIVITERVEVEPRGTGEVEAHPRQDEVIERCSGVIPDTELFD